MSDQAESLRLVLHGINSEAKQSGKDFSTTAAEFVGSGKAEHLDRLATAIEQSGGTHGTIQITIPPGSSAKEIWIVILTKDLINLAVAEGYDLPELSVEDRVCAETVD